MRENQALRVENAALIQKVKELEAYVKGMHRGMRKGTHSA